MLSLNQKAKLSIQPLSGEPDRYRVLVARTGAGATLIDCGVKAPGSFGAGVLFSRACLAGLAEISVSTASVADLSLPIVNVSVDRPVEACMASQYAGWAINKGGYFAMASGPARALAAGEDLFGEISHSEKSDEAVICLEAGAYPTDEAEEYILKKTGVRPENLTILVARTASVTGSIQIAARIVETAIHKMHEIGFALDSVIHGAGSCPAAPVAADDMAAIGRTNDMVLYAGAATLTVDCDDGFLGEKIGLIPSSASKDYGRTFGELFREYGDFYKIDPMLFSPASVTLVNARSGRVYSAGSVNANMITKSLQGGLMKAGILRYRDGWHIDRLAEAMEARGVECVRLPITGLALSMGGGAPVSCGGVDLLGLDALIVRIIPLASMEQLLFRMNALRRLAALGVRVVNHPEVIEKTVDKSHTSALLADAGFATPRTAVCESFEGAMAAFGKMGDAIVKPLHGSCGAGMVRVSDTDMAYRVFRTMEMSRYVYYLQEYVECGGADVRVFVAGGKAVAAMKRTGKGWKANFNAGGKTEPCEPTGTQAKEAVRAAALLGADYAGVDFLRGRDGKEYLIEVNGIPGWKGLQSVTDIDIAEKIVDVFAP